jgi:hypothetical protein
VTGILPPLKPALSVRGERDQAKQRYPSHLSLACHTYRELLLRV